MVALAKTKTHPFEADMVAQGVEEVYINIVESYIRDLKRLLEEPDITERKAFLGSFINRIEIERIKQWYTITYHYHRMRGGRWRQKFYLLIPLVELGGFEPPTSAMRTQHSPY